MNGIPLKLCVPLLSLLLCWCLPGMAATVYKTTDENGAVSFSDTPPQDAGAAQVIHIDTPEPQSPEESAKQLEAMRETTDRMAADRREREQHRADLRAREAPAASQPPAPAPNYTIYSSGGYPNYYPVRWPGYSHHRPGPRPGHPDARPPLRPQEPPQGSSNAQLMRPIVSKRR